MAALNILLVDDDDIDVKGVQRAFKKAGLAPHLLRAHDGEEALAMLRGEASQLPKRPIVLLDLNMPRMNGLEFLAAIRNDDALKNLVVFVMTTSADERDISHAYAHNVAGYIVKRDAGATFARLPELLRAYTGCVTLP
ncbi:MAG: two-component system response regulator [Myxococcales bacterium]|nr:two-component system response regulator [Myxococcales bacterium]